MSSAESQIPPPCPGHRHEWGPAYSIREPDFNVAYGSVRTCKRCGWQEGENYCETRASGGAIRLHPPGTIKL